MTFKGLGKNLRPASFSWVIFCVPYLFSAPLVSAEVDPANRGEFQIENAHIGAATTRLGSAAIIPLNWDEVSEAITENLHDAHQLYSDDSPEEAIWLVGHTYFSIFEADGHGGMEIAIGHYLSKARMIEVERAFMLIQQRMLRGEAKDLVREAIMILGDMLIQDAAALAKVEVSPVGFFTRPTVRQTLAASAIFAFSWLVAIALLYRARRLLTKYDRAMWSLAAGFVLGVAFLFIYPEAAKLADYRWGGIFFMVGLLFMAFCEFTLGASLCKDCPGCPYVCRKLVVFIALFHSVIEGSLIGIGFEINANVGWITTIGLLFHEIPEGLALLMVIIRGSNAKRVVGQLMAVTMMVPVSALAASWLYPSLSAEAVGGWLMFGVAFFTYFAVRGVFPELVEKKEKADLAWLVAGLAIICGAQVLTGI